MPAAVVDGIGGRSVCDSHHLIACGPVFLAVLPALCCLWSLSILELNPRTIAVLEESSMISVTDNDAVRSLLLDRPEALNAFNNAMFDGLTDALLTAADDDSVKVVIISRKCGFSSQ